MKYLKYTLVPLLFVLAACTSGFDAEKSKAVRTVLIQNIEAANAAGIDPIQLPPEKLIYFSLACATASSLATIWYPDMPELSSEGLGWCTLVAEAASKAD